MNLLQQQSNLILLVFFHFLRTLSPYKFLKGNKHAGLIFLTPLRRS